MPPIYVMIKPVSGACNMNCQYCFYKNEMQNRSQALFGKMTDKTLENVVRKTLEFAEGACTFSFQGGEPTLAGLDFYKKLLELEQKYNRKKILIHNVIQTNGYELNQQWCTFFVENNFLVGISVDGVRTAHDAFRKDQDGNNTYFRVLESVKMLQEAKCQFNILTVVNAKTAPKISRIYEQYRKLGFFWQQYIACLDPIWEMQNRQEYSLTPEAYGQFLIELFDLWDSDLKKGRQPYIRQFENYIGILLGQMPESCEQRGVCSYQSVIEADGSVYPCDFYVLDDYKIGNLNENDFEEMNANRAKIRFVENSLNYVSKCRECIYFTLCRGGCRRHREQPGTVLGENWFCQSYQMFFSARWKRLEEIAEGLKRF